jgi:DNA-binding winged helix-turn-helix (wHTH) protein
VDRQAPIRLEEELDFVLGGAVVRPAQRRIEYGGQSASLEPRMMQVLAALAEREGNPVSRRELFTRCWNNAPVGEDSLNRVIAGLRRVASGLCRESWGIETVTGLGYFLSIPRQGQPADATGEDDGAMDAAWTAWRIDAPVVPEREIAALRALTARQPGNARAWAMLAYMLRLGAEYGEPGRCGQIVLDCEVAATTALALSPGDPVATTALLTLRPIYGDWTARHAALARLVAQEPANMVAAHELAILEMACGRVASAVGLVEAMLARDPRAPALLYKRIFHLWSLGAASEMDRIADMAVQLWPQHLAIGMARYWSFIGTGRVAQARMHLAEMRLPPPAANVMELTLAAMDERRPPARNAAVAANMAAAGRGPAQGIAAIMHLSLLGALDEAFTVAEGYYLRRGAVPVGLARSASDPHITDQARRVTQLLFVPACAAMRADVRFEALVCDIGLDTHWSEAACNRIIAPSDGCA